MVAKWRMSVDNLAIPMCFISAVKLLEIDQLSHPYCNISVVRSHQLQFSGVGLFDLVEGGEASIHQGSREGQSWNKDESVLLHKLKI